jgi:transketolase
MTAAAVPPLAAPVRHESMRDRFYRVAPSLLDTDPRVAVVLADIGTDAFDLAAARHPGRVLNVGIREQLLIGASAGLSLAGLRPIVHTYAPFLVERPFEQLKLDLGHNDLGAVLVSVGASFDASSSGRTHQAPEDVAILSALPGWRVDVPGHPDEVEAMLRAAVDRADRTYLRLSELANDRAVGATVDGAVDGRMVVIRRGRDATVLAVGPALDEVTAAVEDLDVTVLYATTVRPFDGATLLANMPGPQVVVVEPYLEGSSASVVSEALRFRAHRLLSIGVPLVEPRHYGEPLQHLVAYGLDALSLGRRIRAFLDHPESRPTEIAQPASA